MAAYSSLLVTVIVRPVQAIQVCTQNTTADPDQLNKILANTVRM